jgi:hypothetical protein
MTRLPFRKFAVQIVWRPGILRPRLANLNLNFALWIDAESRHMQASSKGGPKRAGHVLLPEC